MGNKLYVGNLPYSMRDGDLEQAFSQFGVLQIHVATLIRKPLKQGNLGASGAADVAESGLGPDISM